MSARPGVYGYFGMSGSGKTYALKNDVYNAYRAGDRVLVLDIAEEWHKGPKDIVATRFRQGGIERAIESLEKRQTRFAIVQDFEIESFDAESAAQWAIDNQGTLAIAEAHNVYPSEKKRPTKAMDKLITAWRHRKSALYWDSQRISRMNRTVVEQTTRLHMFAVVGDRDLDVVSGIHRDLPEKALEAARYLESGKAGYHVALSLSRLPPHQLVRK